MPIKISDPNFNLEAINKILSYNPENGDFEWKVRRGGSAKAGCKAGFLSNGYIIIKIFSRRMYAHRLAWFMRYGIWPENEIDHIDGDKSNNRIANLRPANRSENCSNKRIRSDNTSGYKGVRKDGNLWRSRIMKNGKSYNLGWYSTPQEAHQTYCIAAKEKHREYHRLA